MLRRAVKTLLVNGPGANSAIKGAAMSAVRQEKWDLYAGVLLERMPIITKALEPIEKEYLVRVGLILIRCLNLLIKINSSGTFEPNRIRAKP